MKLDELTSVAAVEAAMAECRQLGRDAFLKKYGYKYSRLYPLYHEGEIYDSKAITGVAYGNQHGVALKANEFVGGQTTVIPTLQRLGFSVGLAPHPLSYLEVGRTYLRKNLRDIFGGQLQAGIWTPREFHVIFLFTGISGERYGYRDGWTADGLFQYTGEGQDGDMAFTKGNKAVRDHRLEKKDLLLFEDLGKGKGVRFVGTFDCASWNFVVGHAKNKTTRQLIVFSLAPVTASHSSEFNDDKGAPNLSIAELKKRAYMAVTSSGPIASRESKRIWRERSDLVRRYVLARANGFCEACGQPGPFKRRDGSPYLEPHHTTRLADEGPDHPAWVGAICPTCHRRIHSGVDGEEWNLRLQRTLEQKEQG